MEGLDSRWCHDVSGGLTPLQALSVWGWGYTIGSGLVSFTTSLGNYLGAAYGEDSALEAFRGGNLGA